MMGVVLQLQITNIILCYNINMHAISDNKVSWKGKTINQITSSIQKNKLNDGAIKRDNIFRALPLKIYRREIATNIPKQTACANSKISNSIDELNRPGGYIITSPSGVLNYDGKETDVNGIVTDWCGLVNVIETPQPSNSTQTYECQGANTSYTCAETNARRRCRSSGIIKRTYDPARSEMSYFTNSNQYLVSRSKTFSQNQYRHVRVNDVSIVTNPLVSKEVYSPNGISHCQKFVLSSPLTFGYYWIDVTVFNVANLTTVTIPAGSYDVHDLNAAFESEMIKKYHFFIYSHTNANVFLMKIIYNNTNERIEIQTFPSSNVSNSSYLLPIKATWSLPVQSKLPVFYFPNTAIQNMVGFKTGYYPDIVANPTANQTTTPIGFLSNMSHSIYPSYSIMHYKPSNARFATQGGVSSGDMITRLKYETIQKNALNTSAIFGPQVGSAMSYGVSESAAYTAKDKLGYPVIKTPVIDKYSGELKCLSNARRAGYCSSSPNG